MEHWQALLILLWGGFMVLAATHMAQTIVQLRRENAKLWREVTRLQADRYHQMATEQGGPPWQQD